jgi:hypothetical protein
VPNDSKHLRLGKIHNLRLLFGSLRSCLVTNTALLFSNRFCILLYVPLVALRGMLPIS